MRRVGCQANCPILEEQNRRNRAELKALAKELSRSKDDEYRTRRLTSPLHLKERERRKEIG